MNDKNRMNAIRGETLNSMARTEMLFTFLLGLCGVAEIVGLIAVFWFIDWSNPTHRLIFAATMLVWVNLALWAWALAVRNRVGEQRILRAINTLIENTDEEVGQ
jgi:hypothetical protein